MGTLRREDTLAEARISAFKYHQPNTSQSFKKKQKTSLSRPPSYQRCLFFGQTRQATLSTQSFLLLMPQKSKLTSCVCIPQSAVSNSSGLESLRNFPQPYNVSQSTMRNRLQRARNCILFAFLHAVPCCWQKAVCGPWWVGGAISCCAPDTLVLGCYAGTPGTREGGSVFRAADVLSIFATQIYASPPWGLSVSSRCKHSPSSCK